MTVKEHLKKLHAGAAEFHTEAAKCHKSAMESCDEQDSPAAAFHKGMMNAHLGAAESHVEQADACQKVSGGDELQPLGKVTAVNPGPRLIPRPGQPDREQKADVPAEFQKLVSVD